MKHKDFSGLKGVVYLDNAATTQKPSVVVDAMVNGLRSSANVHRSLHSLGEKATADYENARSRVAGLFSTGNDQVVFTSGTTHALNTVARMLESFVHEGDNVVVTEMDHHSNIVPWQELAKRKKLNLYIVRIDHSRALRPNDFDEFITEKTKIVAFPHVSNVLGTINPVSAIAAVAKRVGAYVVVDGAQAPAHFPVRVDDLGVDFYACGAHKMYGPPGIGMLWINRVLLDDLSPVDFGGEMVKEVFADRASWNEFPWKFEAGTPNVVGAIGFGAAAEYIKKIGYDRLQVHEKMLSDYLDKRFHVNGISRFGPLSDKVGIFSFVVPGVHAHDVAQVLSDAGVAVRAGHACAMPLMRRLGVSAVVRVSFAFYNKKSDVDALLKGLSRVHEVFS